MLNLKEFLSSIEPEVEAREERILELAVNLRQAIVRREVPLQELIALARAVEGFRISLGQSLPSIYYNRKSIELVRERYVEEGYLPGMAEWPVSLLTCAERGLAWAYKMGNNTSKESESMYAAIAYLFTMYGLEETVSAVETLKGRALYGAPEIN